MIIRFSNEQERTGIRLPLSKSIEARRMILERVRGQARYPRLAPEDRCADLKALESALMLYNQGGRSQTDVGSSGTALRFLTALIAATPGRETILTGSEQLERRPVAPLVEVLRRMGADIRYLGREGFIPLEIKGKRLDGSRASLEAMTGAGSSQYLSALLLVEPLLASPLPPVDVAGMVSEPYLRMTRRMIAGDDRTETDWSAASYFYLTALLTGKNIRLDTPLTPPALSKQGDSRCEALFARLGVKTIYEPDYTLLKPQAVDSSAGPLLLDMSATPDLVPAVALAAGFRQLPCRLTGIGHLRLKESDRLQSVTEALQALGIEASHTDCEIIIAGTPRRHLSQATVDCHDDHRIAMAAAPCASFLTHGLILPDGECVVKSFPAYYHRLHQLGFEICE